MFDEGDVDAVVTSRRDEEAKEERKTWFSLETKSKQMKELSQFERQSQSKGELPYADTVMREQGNYNVGAALSVSEKVNAICNLIQNSLADLAHCVQGNNPPSVIPKISVAQIPKAQDQNIGLMGLLNQVVRVGTEEVCARTGLRQSTLPVAGSTK